MKRAITLAAITLAFTFSNSAATAATTATSTPAISSLTVTPSSTTGGRVFLRASGTGIERYELAVGCPDLVFVKVAGRDLCEGTHRLAAKKLRRLLLTVRNPNGATGTISIALVGINADGEAVTPVKTVLLPVKPRQ
jgi:hypothetical protein